MVVACPRRDPLCEANHRSRGRTRPRNHHRAPGHPGPGRRHGRHPRPERLRPCAQRHPRHRTRRSQQQPEAGHEQQCGRQVAPPLAPRRRCMHHAQTAEAQRRPASAAQQPKVRHRQQSQRRQEPEVLGPEEEHGGVDDCYGGPLRSESWQPRANRRMQCNHRACGGPVSQPARRAIRLHRALARVLQASGFSPAALLRSRRCRSFSWSSSRRTRAWPPRGRGP